MALALHFLALVFHFLALVFHFLTLEFHGRFQYHRLKSRQPHELPGDQSDSSGTRTFFKSLDYRGQESGSGRLVDSEQQADECDDVVFDERLVQQRVEHAGAEDAPSGERQSEHWSHSCDGPNRAVNRSGHSPLERVVYVHPKSSKEANSPIYGPEHPINQGKIRDGIQKGNIGPPLQE
ncbi:unnamed protein product [Nesidiocoris tenuis]|uniref:Uncharacterized protein n=1 Tax=Nesidiocoris tenuis TaxID=355587 RepID=A0A6H5GAE6_9HEMI|nr:unnamed protein product [Nesidiocoris tenuis]